MLDMHIGSPGTGSSVVEQLVALIPTLAWIGLVLMIFFVIGPSNFRKLLARAQRIGFAGIEINLREEISAAAKERSIEISPEGKAKVAERLSRSAALFQRARILWVDDHLLNNQTELSILDRLGAVVDLCTTTAEAKRQLAAAAYAVVISDMKRGGNERAGLELLDDVRNHVSRPLLIFYVGSSEIDRPRKAFGITKRPDVLFHLLIEALERRSF